MDPKLPHPPSSADWKMGMRQKGSQAGGWPHPFGENEAHNLMLGFFHVSSAYSIKLCTEIKLNIESFYFYTANLFPNSKRNVTDSTKLQKCAL